MRSWWSPLSRRLALVREARRGSDGRLLARSFAVALATPALMRLPLPRLGTLLDWAVTRGPARVAADPEAVSNAVLRVLEAGRPLVRRGCLTRGVTLYYCLRRAGVDVELSFGMGRAEGGDGFDGHCWLMRDGAPYLEPTDPRQRYATMVTFRRGGISEAPESYDA